VTERRKSAVRGVLKTIYTKIVCASGVFSTV
jgi:hypothetical protein